MAEDGTVVFEDDGNGDKEAKTLKSGHVLRVYRKVPDKYACKDGLTGYYIKEKRKGENVPEDLGLPFRELLFFEKARKGSNPANALCRVCLKKLSWSGNASAAIKHFKSQHMLGIVQTPVLNPAEKRSYDTIEQARREGRAKDTRTLKDTLAAMLASHAGAKGLPLTFCDSDVFPVMVAYINAMPASVIPTILPSRDLLRRKLLDNGALVMDKVKQLLSRADAVSIQLDGWGDKSATMHVLGVCAQIYVDGALRTLNVDIEPLSSPATAEEYERALLSLLGRFSVAVTEKNSIIPLALTGDGAATNASLFSNLETKTGAVGMLCAAHALHNAVCAAVSSSKIIKSLIQDTIHVNLKFKNCRALKAACIETIANDANNSSHKRVKRTIAPKAVIETLWSSLPSAIRNFLENMAIRRMVLVRFDGSRVHDIPVGQPPKWRRAKAALFDNSLELFLRDMITVMEPFEFFSINIQSAEASIGTLYLDLGKLIAGLYDIADKLASEPAKAFAVLLRQQIEARFLSCVPRNHRTPKKFGVRPNTDGQPTYGWGLNACVDEDPGAEDGDVVEEDPTTVLDEIEDQAEDDTAPAEGEVELMAGEIVEIATPGAVYQCNVPPGIYSLDEQRTLGMSPLDARRAAVYAVAAFMHPELLGRHYLPESLIDRYGANLAVKNFTERTASYVMQMLTTLSRTTSPGTSDEHKPFSSAMNPVEVEAMLFNALKPLVPKSSNAHVDALELWSATPQTPLLHQIAKGYLTIPPTSAGPERLFSRLGFVYSERRRRMTVETLRAYIHNQDLTNVLPSFFSSSS